MNILDFSCSYADVKKIFSKYLLSVDIPVRNSLDCIYYDCLGLYDSMAKDVNYPMSCIELGLKELRCDCISRGFVSPVIFVPAFSILTHEAWHICRMRDFHNVTMSGENLNLQKLAVSRLSICGNDDLYVGSHHYIGFEADANLHGFVFTRNYLHQNFDSGVDDFLLDLYHAGELFPETKFVADMSFSKPCTIDDLGFVFSDVADYCFNIRKQYASHNGLFAQDDYGHVDKDAEIKALKASKDLFAKTILGRRWRDVLDAYLTSTSAE